ncbi:MAG: excinuclease ABC subunit UvrC [Chloroflexi bacterium]|nr:excinuclease ABC subunit UvrC [Chloroflexota bacterium]
MTGNLINEQLKQLPTSPGVYLMKGSDGTILYVGKATDLHNRVRSYFQSPLKLTPKIQQLIAEANELEFFITGSEQEALILECNLIKQYRPHYNVRLKDDKAFPYIRINLNEDWPTVSFTRRLKDDGARYFGPFTNVWSVKQTLKVLESIFRFRSCNRTITGTDKRPCLKYHLGRCLAPCIGVVSKGEYKEAVKQVGIFLEGKQGKVVRELEWQMKLASEALNFERAARLRNQVQAIKSVIEGQKIAATVSGEEDAIAFVTDKDQAYVQVFFVRGGKLIGRESFVLTGTNAEEPRQIMTSFVKQFYDSATHIPPLLLLQHPMEDRVAIQEWLKQKRGGAVNFSVPRRGNKKKLLQIVAENAEQGLQQMKVKQLAAPSVVDAALRELQEKLGLPHLPARLEGYDISNIQGKEAVGSMVVFDNGRPKPSHYRRFRIKTVLGANDYEMLQEVLRRRFKRVAFDKTDAATKENWGILPDLVIIDGGKGQLNMARSVMKEVGASIIPIASLAKKKEEIFIPNRKTAIVLPRNSPGLQLLQRLRDEAHRFAVAYYTKVHKKKTFTSSLDGISGIGPKCKHALLKQFGSVKAIKDASLGDLTTVKGMTPNLAERLKEHLG